MSDNTIKNDSQLYNEIASVLFQSSTAECIKICMLLRLSADSKHSKTEAFGFDTDGNEISFLVDDSFGNMHDLAVELKNYFLENNLTNGMPGWRYLWVEVDVVNNKVKFDFAYDEDNREDKFKFSYE
ncbi:hypothetical protein [Thorsellia kenyensis]|uniref:Uncharacterized protein n=1 Tax=Thorsellia kenyensis TaxID=1549888 RepID=A0ABV6CDF4_9GAMM